jgi:hypothetical protein
MQEVWNKDMVIEWKCTNRGKEKKKKKRWDESAPCAGANLIAAVI